MKLLKVVTITTLALFCLFVVTNPLLAQGLSFTTNTYAVGSNPNCVVAADVNGDGKVDLISANYWDSSLTVLTNNGNGGFCSNATVNVNPHPNCIAVADVNGDGKPDLICGILGLSLGPPHGYGPSITVLTNSGSGVFGSNSIAQVGIGPVSVVSADVDGDGKMDLISADFNTVTVWTNNGSGGFGKNATLSVGYGPCCVAAADVNGDGKVDLISVNQGNPAMDIPDTLTVLTNNGSGVFGSNATLNVGSTVWSVIAADINGDGKPDLISANYGDNTLTVYTNNGGGVFGSNATLTVGLQPESVIASDFYGNGKVDLISANSGDNTLTVLTNDGSGVFGSNATLNVGNRPACVVAADVNNDGHLDLISVNFGDSTLTVLTQIPPPPPLTEFAPCFYPVGNNPQSVAVADVNGDGRLDLITANADDATLTVMTNDRSGIFGSNATYSVGLLPYCVVAADVNGDGKPDLVCANTGTNTLTVLTNNGSGGFVIGS